MTRESSIESRGQQDLEGQGWQVVKWGREGWPDRLILVGYGLHVWLEWKAPDGGLTPAQKRRIPKLLAIGELVLVVDSWRGIVERVFQMLPGWYLRLYKSDPAMRARLVKEST